MLFNGYLLHFYNIYTRTQKHCQTRIGMADCARQLLSNFLRLEQLFSVPAT